MVVLDGGARQERARPYSAAQWWTRHARALSLLHRLLLRERGKRNSVICPVLTSMGTAVAPEQAF